MKVLVVGSGGREHALIWRLARSPRGPRLYCAPGNPGIERHAQLVAIDPTDVEGLVAFAKQEGIFLTIVGPEAALVAGIGDRFREEGLAIVGPTKAMARLESSKAFAKDLMSRHGIPTARYGVFEALDSALAFAQQLDGRCAIKADGLAAGKGVLLTSTVQEAEEALRDMLERGRYGKAGSRVVVEEFLEGPEASVLALVDGERLVVMAPARDHKAALDHDRGPNTGGMGAFSPVPDVGPRLVDQVIHTILAPTVRAMAEEGTPYQGILYAGLKLTAEGPKVLEFNCRFGDPETQPLMMRLRSDLADVMQQLSEGDLAGVHLDWDPRPAVCVVLTAGGYPGHYVNGLPIQGVEQVAQGEDLAVFQAGTRWEDDHLVTAGGRVLGVTALGDTQEEAANRAYEAVARIHWPDLHYRTDIGRRHP